MSIKDAVKLIEESEARFVDLRFTDTKGKQHHFTVPARSKAQSQISLNGVHAFITVKKVAALA